MPTPSTSRREFLGAGAALLATGITLPGFLARTASAAAPRRDDTILVIVQMTGGNDGLNTVVPYRHHVYRAKRPTLALHPDRVHKIGDSDLAFHPDMAAFKDLYDEGLLQVISNVGYPNPDRSHFRSMDIWHTADTARPEDADAGWLGRVIDAQPRGEAPFALHLDHGVLPLALHAESRPVPSLRGIDAFSLKGDEREVERVLALPRDAGGKANEELMYVQRLAIASARNAQRLSHVAGRTEGARGYPGHGLADRLRQIAELIGADFGPRIYYTSLGGFDTHAQQRLAHGPLLRELSESVRAFYADLKRRGEAGRVVLMTFSEFGRRVAENGGQGTDHGVGAPMFLVGPACKAGMIGKPPDLDHLVEGDIRHEIDFRRVYAAVLDRWLRIDHAPILGQRYQPLDLIA